MLYTQSGYDASVDERRSDAVITIIGNTYTDNTWRQGGYNIGTGAYYNNANRICTTTAIPISAATTYTFVFDSVKITNPRILIHYYTGIGGAIMTYSYGADGSYSITFTPTVGTVIQIEIYSAAAIVPADLCGCQFDVGTTSPYYYKFTKAPLTRVNLIEEVSPTSETLPMSELNFSFDNTVYGLTPMSSTGVIDGIPRGTMISVRFGLGGATLGYTDNRYYFIDHATTDDGGMTIDVVAYDAFAYLDTKTFNRGEYTTTSAAMQTVVNYILNGTGISGTASGLTVPYPYLIPNVSVKEALRMLAQKMCCQLRWNATTKKIEIKTTTPYVTPNGEIGINDQYNLPAITTPDYVNAVDVNIYEWRAKELDNSVYVEKTQHVNGTLSVVVPHEAAKIVNVICSGGTIVIEAHYLYYSVIVVSAADVDVTVQLWGFSYGYEKIDSYEYSTAGAGETVYIRTIDNPSITSAATAEQVATWTLGQLPINRMFEISGRGNPAFELWDFVTVASEYAAKTTTLSYGNRILKQEFDFDGTLKSYITTANYS